jgi:hypothetical protein
LLFGYPVAATHNNWLHECLCEALKNVHAAVDAGTRYPGWPKILPLAHQAVLRSRRGLRDRMCSYDRAIRLLSRSERDDVLQAVEDQNRISDLLAGLSDCVTITDLPHAVREPVAALFSFAYDLLEPLGLRDPHYAAIYESIPEHVCPFCGTEYFDAPVEGVRREELDHYLAKSLYPFAAANLRNLVPMGHKCNASYKHTSNLLRCSRGARRVAFDPYSHTKCDVVLDESDPFNGVTSNTPLWVIRFEPDSPAVATWDDVFKIRERYCRNWLDPSFRSWLDLFRRSALRSGMRLSTNDEIVVALKWFEDLWVMNGMQQQGFLKAAVFRMLRLNCESGNTRLLDQLRDAVASVRP